MNLVLILRCEVVCLVVLSFIMWYSVRYGVKDYGQHFFRMMFFAIGHVVFDVITVITVNNLDAFPKWFNFVCHIIFYLFAILFCYELLAYVLYLIFPPKKEKLLSRLALLMPFIYGIVVSVLPIDYLTGRGTNYSYGPSAILGYAMAMVMFFISEALLLLNHKKLEENVKRSLIPGFVLMSLAIILQIVVPELLYTGACVTMVSGAMFFAVADPADVYRKKAYFDIASGINNRNCYNDEMEKLDERYGTDLKANNFLCLTCDLNGLKQINDKFGHAAGDEYIRSTAMLLRKTLKNAFNVYRTGGDEFVALYVGKPIELAVKEIEDARARCRESRMSNGFPISAAFGYVIAEEGEDVYDVAKRADAKMFEEKSVYYSVREHDRRKY